MKRLGLILCLVLFCQPAFTFQKKRKDKADLTVVSFNIRYGTPGDGVNKWKSRKKLIFNVFKKYRGGIIATQEALLRQIDELEDEIPKMGVVYRTRQEDDESGESMAIFYDKKTWKELDEETFWFSDTPDEPGSKSWGNSLPRITTVAVFESKINGKKIRIVNTHLDHRSENSREKSIDLILSKIKSYDASIPTIIVGDLNAEPDDPIIKKLEAQFEDSYIGPSIEGCTYHKWDGGRHCERIDYIFYPKNSGFELLDSGIDRYKKQGRFPSDHFPIYAKFKLN
jgi:endonuclease/exonuclease/phosphatase family metal-dependent hydrolase